MSIPAADGGTAVRAAGARLHGPSGKNRRIRPFAPVQTDPWLPAGFQRVARRNDAAPL